LEDGDIADTKDTHSISSSAHFESISTTRHRTFGLGRERGTAIQGSTAETLRRILSTRDGEASAGAFVDAVGVSQVVAIG